MKRNEVINAYFNWMYNLVCEDGTYSKLLSYLHDRDFVVVIPLDDSRAADGIELRYQFARENNYPYPVVAECLDDRPCSILEMLIALSIRCEEQIMSDPDIGNRTSEWFWTMIGNLGLSRTTNRIFAAHKPAVDDKIDIFLNRTYDRDGKGGLFTVKDCKYDMRTVDIWYQMCWYLASITDN